MTPATAPPLDARGWARVSALFDTAIDLPDGERVRWLAAVTQAEPAIAPWLQQMVAAHAARATDDWLERGPTLRSDAGLGADAHASGLHPGDRVGPWVLGALLGSGGMATVWRAVRADALPARDVALKLPLAHRAGSLLVERFAREQAILARLEHPSIARLYAAGVTDDGTPWLAMECVDGAPIDRWCDAHKLPVAQRLALFAQVLQAVQYAHARLVIHRDLKPGNIFVNTRGQVQLLDFGIARLLQANGDNDGDGAEPSALTQAAGRAMTTAYAAPEQVRGDALTTAVDVYALGVVLFELLAGASPYRVTKASAVQLEAAVAAADVQRASAASTDAAATSRGCSLAALRRSLRGDLDTLLAKALALDPARRYASAAAFADDVARVLDGRPITARRASAWYRLGKWTRRHRWQAAAAGAVLVSVLAGSGLALWQARVATSERNAARAEAERSIAINFFFSDLLEEAARSDRPIDGEQLVKRAEALARSEFADNPDALAAVLLSIGMLHNSHGRQAEARRVLEEAYAGVRDPAFRDDIACDLALLIDDAPRAITMLSAVAAQPRTSARSRAACLVYLGDLLRADDAALALQRYGQAMASWQQSASRSPHDRITILGRIAFAAALQGRSADALRGYDEALKLADGLGRDASAMGSALRNRVGRVLLIAGAPERALPVFEQLLAEQAQRQPGAPLPADVLLNQGQALLDLHRAVDALAPLQAAAVSARAGGSAPRQAQAACLLRWAAALTGGDAQPAQALPASTSSALAAPDPLARAACALADAQAHAARREWAALDAQLTPLLAQRWAEPQWAVDALLLRADARWHLGRRDDALSDATRALAEARRLHDGPGEPLRAQAAQALRAGPMVTSTGR